MPECNDSDAISASLKRPGMRYVNDLRANSICETEEEFLVMNWRYLSRYSDGRDKVDMIALGEDEASRGGISTSDLPTEVEDSL